MRRPEPAPAPAPRRAEPAPVDPATFTRRDILDDPKLNAILSSIPGAAVLDIKEVRK